MTTSGCTVHGPKRPASTEAAEATTDLPSPKRPCVEESTNALIYQWTLDRIDPAHPLFGTPYIGQVVRAGLTCQEMFHKRKREHITGSCRQPKELGLHWAIRVFGEGAFTVRMVETTRLPRKQAMEWANAREIALIAEHGGVMRDCEPSAQMHQTLNLTSGGQGNVHQVSGGQGNASNVWEGLQASSRKKLMKVWPKFKAYYEAHEDLRVPFRDPDLGMIVNRIRSRNDFLWHEDFKAWLDEHGFVYDARRAHLEEEVWPKFKAYYEAHGNLRVPRSDPDLGRIVGGIRSQNHFLWHADFKAWLYERGFKMHARDATTNAERWAAVNGPPPVPGG
ncbi:hypothetical protein TrST_g5533 [Triparma strigata]|uniref:Helicase-associated domain-containing protein n=1 Tax=Triparma strigata TaxID=1606541 RepID=A0A9W7BHA9_9STRA|nr:hypothetical protein TrST_g5533 [Triparma strigata]